MTWGLMAPQRSERNNLLPIHPIRSQIIEIKGLAYSNATLPAFFFRWKTVMPMPRAVTMHPPIVKPV
jgi:hypothetical protein